MLRNNLVGFTPQLFDSIFVQSSEDRAFLDQAVLRKLKQVSRNEERRVLGSLIKGFIAETDFEDRPLSKVV